MSAHDKLHSLYKDLERKMPKEVRRPVSLAMQLFGDVLTDVNRIANALEKLAATANSEPVDKELAAMIAEKGANPDCIVVRPSGARMSVPGEWVRIDDKIIVAPLAHTVFDFGFDRSTGLWHATDKD